MKVVSYTFEFEGDLLAVEARYGDAGNARSALKIGEAIDEGRLLDFLNRLATAAKHVEANGTLVGVVA